MGFNNTATTTTLTAKLTPLGRKKLILTNNNLVESFSLGDSDANYYAALPLTTGEVPTLGGDIGAYGSVSNSVAENVDIKSFLLVNSSGKLRKEVEPESSKVLLEFISNSESTISGSNITQAIINRNNYNTDPLVNLYYSFNLPLNSYDDYNFTGLTSASGGFSNTALSGIATTKILVIGLKNSSYGELIDGKSIKISLATTATTYTLYSTFQNTGLLSTIQDASYVETAANTANFGKNIAFLFSDGIQKPNGGNASLSWSTGYDATKPFSIGSKQLYNLVTDTNQSQTADTVVGIAYLDKGFMVITHPTIVNNFTASSSATVVTCNSVSTSVSQNITCISNRGEFGSSTNPTFNASDTPRISEVGLYDSDGDLIAIAKLDRHLVKNLNDFFALGIRISL